jgi:hypothetical protein
MDRTHGRRSVGAARVLGVSFILVAAGLFTSCSSHAGSTVGAGSDSGMQGMAPGEMNGDGYMGHPAAMVSDWVLPEYATAVPMVAEAYAFAVEHPEVVSYLPCACGCEAMGHNSNWNCYVQSVTSSGEVVFDTHAQGCNVCIDITLDGKRMWQRGSPLSEIRQYIDEHYDATMQTELPPAA